MSPAAPVAWPSLHYMLTYLFSFLFPPFPSYFSPTRRENVVLEHNTASGLRKITLPSRNNEVLHESTKAFDTGSVHFLQVHEKEVIVTIATNYMGFKYNLSCDGKHVQSHLEKLGAVQQDYTFSVTAHEIKDKVVYYTVTTKSGKEGPGSGEVVGTSSKRFSEFDDLFGTLQSMFGSSHLSGSIPQLPSKGIKLTDDQLAKPFIENRMQELNTFMSNLASFPGLMDVPGILEFVGVGNSDV